MNQTRLTWICIASRQKDVAYRLYRRGKHSRITISNRFVLRWRGCCTAVTCFWFQQVIGLNAHRIHAKKTSRSALLKWLSPIAARENVLSETDFLWPSETPFTKNIWIRMNTCFAPKHIVRWFKVFVLLCTMTLSSAMKRFRFWNSITPLTLLCDKLTPQYHSFSESW